MLPPLPCRTSFFATTALFVVGAGFAAAVFQPLLKTRSARRALLLAYLVLLGFHGAWAYGARVSFAWSYWGATAACVALVLTAMVVGSLPIAALVRGMGLLAFRFFASRKAKVGSPLDDGPAPVESPPLVSRRTVLGGITASVPLAAIAAGAQGFATADDPPGTPRRALTFAGLPQELAGLQILHLTDLHLGVGRSVKDLEALFLRLEAAKVRPDMIVLTGDIAEHVDELMPALQMIAAVKPTLGAFACLGNHEYLNGVRQFRNVFDRGPVPLLVDQGVRVRSRGRSLYVAGVDDPIFVRAPIAGKLAKSVDHALRDLGTDDFAVLLSHRPEGFDAASRHGVPLTLSGHTHGGQIAFNGKSVFEPLWPDAKLWGAYGRGTSRLYTSSGFGHWFPFRLGCPTEAPLVVLGTEAGTGRKSIA